MTDRQDDLRRQRNTRWIIYALVALAVLVPFFIKVRMNFTPTPEAKGLFERVDALEPGAHVLISVDYDPASQAELTPMLEALMRHCFRKKLVPVVIVPIWLTGLDMANDACERSARAASKELGRPVKSGTDYVFLGFKPGGSNLLLLMGENLKGAFPKDFHGRSTADMKALAGVTSLKDMKLAVDLAAGATVGMWIAYGSDRFGFPLGAGVTAVQAPDAYPFLNSGQLVGLLGGLRGAADYERLLDVAASGTSGMLSQSAAHLLLIGLIVFANVRMVIDARRRAKGKA